MKGIVPGEYVALAWEQVETGAAEDPEFPGSGRWHIGYAGRLVSRVLQLHLSP